VCFSVLAGRFLGFIVHENGIEVDPKKIEAIRRIEESTCKKDVKSLLGKINYLRQFISNLIGRVESLLPLVRLKHEADFAWEAEQWRAFERIKEYLVSPPTLRAPVAGEPFKVYVATHKKVVGVVLTHECNDKEFVIAYFSKWLLDAETRYTHIEKLCLSLYYACSKFCEYILSSHCIVTCQHDVVKCMMQKPILSGWMGKWAYSLVEYELSYEPLKAVKGQAVANFIIHHGIQPMMQIWLQCTPGGYSLTDMFVTWFATLGMWSCYPEV
jgi:hypothetical protein